MRLIRNFARFIGDAVSSMVKNPLMTIASMLIVTFCLFIFGVFIVLTMNANYMGQRMEEQCQIEINVSKSITEKESLDEIQAQIEKKAEFISNIEYKTGKERFDKFKSKLSANELERFEGVPDTIIDSSYTVTLTDIGVANELVKYFETIDGVTSVKTELELMAKVRSVTDLVKKISIWIVVLFAFISVFIISNTIKLTLHNRRKEINIMKYVGATDAYIRGPFVIEGMIVGIISAAIAYLGTAYGYISLSNFMSSFELSSSVIVLEPFAHLRMILIGAYLIIGAGLGSIGSFISIRRYLDV